MPSPAITLAQANIILDTVIEAGLMEEPKPTSGAEILDVAANVVKSAGNAKRMGNVNPHVLKVLDIASDLQSDPPFDIVENVASTVTSPAPVEPPATENNVSSEDTAASSTHSTLSQPDGEKGSSPQTIEGIEYEEIPRDFSTVSDIELRSLHAKRHALLSKAIFELGLEESDYQSAQVNYDQEYKMAKRRSASDKVTEQREEAFLDQTVIDWRTKVDEHHKRVTMLRAYKEILEMEIRGLSREYTMRLGERVSTP